jgi:ABC-2 type transport system permease protein
MAQYSNFRAMGSMVKASLLAMAKSPSAIIFTIAFPLIFILVFGFLGGGSRFNIRVAAAPGSDTTNSLYQVLKQVDALRWVNKDSASINKMLKEGSIAATVDIKENTDTVVPHFNIKVNAASTEMEKAQQLKNILAGVIQAMDPEVRKRQAQLMDIELKVAEVREYKTIDFILPGQLAFSLLASGVFGTAFIFFNLRQTLVLKRFFATPVRKETIVISEGLARMLFQMLGTIIIISLGHYAFGFTLAKGAVTFIQLVAVCSLALLVFMGFGFIVSGVVKNEAAIPPFANMITLPQFLLAGTFFSIDNFPKWLQPFCKALPMTYLNDALRKISYDGASIWDVRTDMFVLLGWGVALYIIAGKVFKWE